MGKTLCWNLAFSIFLDGKRGSKEFHPCLKIRLQHETFSWALNRKSPKEAPNSFRPSLRDFVDNIQDGGINMQISYLKHLESTKMHKLRRQRNILQWWFTPLTHSSHNDVRKSTQWRPKQGRQHAHICAWGSNLHCSSCCTKTKKKSQKLHRMTKQIYY